MIKELAKFAAGVTAWEAVVHASFAVSGVLPIKLCGVTLTPKLNAIQIVLPALSCAALVYVGWFQQPAGATGAVAGARGRSPRQCRQGMPSAVSTGRGR
ncbi:MAG: hypothetical protein IPL43_06620 [Micropruina sp.]|nr:hypothetical protein [Micropruina sp.]